MKKLLVGFIGSLLTLGFVVPASASDDGLNAEVYVYGFSGVPQRSKDLYPACTTNAVITEVQTLEDLFGAPFQEVIVAGCQNDYVLVHLTGYITLDAGIYTFNFSADDGLFLSIGGQTLTNDAEDWIIKPPSGSTNVPFSANGYSLAVDFWFFDNEFGSYADVQILDSRGNEVSQAGLFSKSPRKVPLTAPIYEGPLNLKLQDVTRSCQPTSYQLTGDRLNSISQITVGDLPVVIKKSSSTLIEFDLPIATPQGRLRVTYSVPVNSLNLFDFITVKDLKACAQQVKISGLAQGSAALPAADLQRVKDLVSGRSLVQNQLVCVGSATIGELANPLSLARARAKAACQAAAPGMRVTTYISVSSKSDGQFRAVTVKLASN